MRVVVDSEGRVAGCAMMHWAVMVDQETRAEGWVVGGKAHVDGGLAEE